jgi:hypothetical protein
MHRSIHNWNAEGFFLAQGFSKTQREGEERYLQLVEASLKANRPASQEVVRWSHAETDDHPEDTPRASIGPLLIDL